MNTTSTINNYKGILNMALKIKQRWFSPQLSNAAYNDWSLAALLLYVFRETT